MKQLPEITIGKYTFEASAEHTGGTVLNVTVKCGIDSLTRKMNDQGQHDRTEAQFEESVNDFALTLAKELGAKIRSTELAKKFASN
jgi:hypothetical protein